jgi:hypothetical protein
MPTTSIAIPLKGREKPVDLPKEYKKVLENELHVRYLESIGAAPSKANMSVIRRHLPPDKCKFHTAWKSRGWVSDTLYITLEDPAQSAKVLAMRKAAAAAADLSAIDKLPASLLQGDVSGGEEEEEDDEPDLEVAVSAPSGAMSFADAQRSFLYPFKHVSAPKPRHARVGAAMSAPPAGSTSPSWRRAGEAGAGSSAAAYAAHRPSAYGDAEEEEYGDAEDGERRRRGGASEDDDGELPFPPGTFDFSSRDAIRYAPFTEREIYAELAEPLELHTKDITRLQQEFLNMFPFERLRTSEAPAAGAGAPGKGLPSIKSSTAPPELIRAVLSTNSAVAVALNTAPMDPIEAAIRKELGSARTARFIGILALFLYWAHLPERCRVARDDERLAKLLCAVQQYFATLRTRMMRKRSSIMRTLPVLLLSARATIEGLFRAAFKKWWTTRDGKATLAAMDRTIEEMFDPCMYHTHIAPLESSTDAIRIAARQGLGVRPRGSVQANLLTTSTLISTALPAAPPVQRRRTLLADSRLPDTEQQMADLATTSVRHVLLKAARHRTNAAEAAVEATRLVDGMIVRPAPGAKTARDRQREQSADA